MILEDGQIQRPTRIGADEDGNLLEKVRLDVARRAVISKLPFICGTLNYQVASREGIEVTSSGTAVIDKYSIWLY